MPKQQMRLREQTRLNKRLVRATTPLLGQRQTGSVQMQTGRRRTPGQLHKRLQTRRWQMPKQQMRLREQTRRKHEQTPLKKRLVRATMQLLGQRQTEHVQMQTERRQTPGQLLLRQQRLTLQVSSQVPSKTRFQGLQKTKYRLII